MTRGRIVSRPSSALATSTGQRLGLFQIEGVEAFGEAAAAGSEEIVGVIPLITEPFRCGPEPSKAVG
jgi:hypothetical protein